MPLCRVNRKTVRRTEPRREFPRQPGSRPWTDRTVSADQLPRFHRIMATVCLEPVILCVVRVFEQGLALHFRVRTRSLVTGAASDCSWQISRKDQLMRDDRSFDPPRLVRFVFGGARYFFPAPATRAVGPAALGTRRSAGAPPASPRGGWMNSFNQPPREVSCRNNRRIIAGCCSRLSS